MREEITDTIVWGRVVTNGKEFLLLSERPLQNSVWQKEGTVKWTVAEKDDYVVRNFNPDFSENAAGDFHAVYERSIVVFGSDALIEFYQDPQTIKVKYVIPDELDDDDVTGNPI